MSSAGQIDAVRPRDRPATGAGGTDDARLTARALADLVAAIGGPAFPNALLDALRTLAGVELCSVFLRDRGEHVELIFAHGELPDAPGFPLRASHAYARSYWRSDRQLAQLAHAPPGVPVVTRRRACDIADPAYRAACYDRAGVAERVSILSPGHPCFAVNGYRTRGSRPFSAQDFARLELHAGLLIAALRQHLRAEQAARPVGDETSLAGRLATLDYGLSAREAEIVAALMLGETQDRIAAAKQLSATTVITYRRRAYGKLGVANRRDLMALHRRLMTAPNPLSPARTIERRALDKE
ncbi:LuxR C-terminal-related transcriptional regulator [Sphingomonas sp. ST-64]|uniref:LuxR C-terminal-related transcriptional regulator n=1 Tax=Sphingomonas plantiphila TaxID=3163295 RepID=A0ABW8YHB4_9SPHN